MKFYLGTHMPEWLGRTSVPLFLSARRLRKRKTPSVAAGSWAVDSGAFTELQKHGRWTVDAMTYSTEVRIWRDRIGGMDWAAPQDWMCEPIVIHGGTVGGITFVGTKLSVREHQRRTVNNYLLLRRLAPDLPWIPVLQGWEHDDYLRHVIDYRQAGIDLRLQPLVGLGSICRRQDTRMAEDLICDLSGMGIKLHAFGFKLKGLARARDCLSSSDSMAWSLDARRNPPLSGCQHRSCANCMVFALRWRDRVLNVLSRPVQGVLF